MNGSSISSPASPRVSLPPPSTLFPHLNNSTTAPKALYTAILSVATLMHVPDQELFECATQIRDLPADDGILVLQLSLHRAGLSNDRDDAGRLYNERPPEEVQLLFERLGFLLVAQ